MISLLAWPRQFEKPLWNENMELWKKSWFQRGAIDPFLNDNLRYECPVKGLKSWLLWAEWALKAALSEEVANFPRASIQGEAGVVSLNDWIICQFLGNSSFFFFLKKIEFEGNKSNSIVLHWPPFARNLVHRLLLGHFWAFDEAWTVFPEHLFILLAEDGLHGKDFQRWHSGERQQLRMPLPCLALFTLVYKGCFTVL